MAERFEASLFQQAGRQVGRNEAQNPVVATHQYSACIVAYRFLVERTCVEPLQPIELQAEGLDVSYRPRAWTFLTGFNWRWMGTFEIRCEGF